MGRGLSSNSEIGFWIKFALNPHLATLCGGRRSAGRRLQSGPGGRRARGAGEECAGEGDELVVLLETAGVYVTANATSFISAWIGFVQMEGCDSPFQEMLVWQNKSSFV